MRTTIPEYGEPVPVRLPEDLEEYEWELAKAFHAGAEAVMAEVEASQDAWPIARAKIRIKYNL